MAANLYPLVYKSGIKRDGTIFQSEYCTSGQWVRFQRGVIKSIGGILGLNYRGIVKSTNNNIPNMFAVTSIGNNNFYIYFVNSNGATPKLLRIPVNYGFRAIPNAVEVIPNIEGKSELVWQFEVIIKDDLRHIVAFASDSAVNIEQNSAPLIWHGQIDNPPQNNLTAINLNDAGIDNKANGGICYVSPYLFVYGSNGYVAYSKDNDPLDFNDGNGSGELKIADDKVIYARPIRGGSASPSVLFWTISSVVKVVNVGDTEVKFKPDTISNSSSVLSSRCIVEYDGVFFWPGIDRFFVYNGVVTGLSNTLNLNYFYDNIDMNHRQKVFGVKKPKFDEIWWFYPTKGQQGTVVNNRAIIFNKRENSWVDTEISMDCGFYFQNRGYTMTLGNPLVGTDPDNYQHLWLHEVGTGQTWEIRNNVTISNQITSSFTTPVFSWAAFNPLKQQTGVDRWMELKRIEPDFLLKTGNEVLVNVISREYAQSVPQVSDPYTINSTTTKIDMNIQGRHMSLKFASLSGFELGHTMLLLSVGDGQ